MLDVMRNLGKAGATAENLEKYYAGESCDYDFGTTNSSNLRGNLDSFLSKIPAAERSLYTTASDNLATSSYTKMWHSYMQTYVPGVRNIDISKDLLYVYNVDVIGQYNVRGVLAF